MSGNNWKNKLLDNFEIVGLEQDYVSGSKSNDKNLETSKRVQNKNIIIPIEQYVEKLSPTIEKEYKNFKLQQLPDLFEIKGLKNDKISEIPYLILTRGAHLFADLLEAKLKKEEEEFKNKTWQ